MLANGVFKFLFESIVFGLASDKVNFPIMGQKRLCNGGSQPARCSENERLHQPSSESGVVYGFPSLSIFVFTEGPRYSLFSICKSTTIGLLAGLSCGKRASNACND